MRINLHVVQLPLQHEFTIARGSKSQQTSLIVELEEGGKRGFGEATEHEYYGVSVDSMSESIQTCIAAIERFEFGMPTELWTQLSQLIPGDPFALAAIDMAAYDLVGKLTGRPAYELMDLKWGDVPESSYTIGIDSIDRMVAKLIDRPDWGIYKVKLGTDSDVEIMTALREKTDAVFRIDANCGWTADQTIENSRLLKNLGVEFIEQPLPPDTAVEEWKRVFKHTVLPIIADESCLVESDVLKCKEHFHGVNVKLSKCGGLTPALRMLREARGLGMKTMIGCMVESTVGISAAAQLLPLLDYADLDGAELLAADAADGVVVTDGCVRLSGRSGCGVKLHELGELSNSPVSYHQG